MEENSRVMSLVATVNSLLYDLEMRITNNLTIDKDLYRFWSDGIFTMFELEFKALEGMSKE